MRRDEQDEQLTTVEAARLLALSAADVYRLIFAGVLDGGPDEQGVVRVSTAALRGYRRQASSPHGET